jgi:hypothetical protein
VPADVGIERDDDPGRFVDLKMFAHVLTPWPDARKDTMLPREPGGELCHVRALEAGDDQLVL